MIQQPIQGNECLSMSQLCRRKNAIHGKTSMQPKSNEHSRTNNIPMRKTPIIPVHINISGRNDI